MPLMPQIVEWRAGAGIDTKTDFKMVDNSPLVLENTVFRKAQSLAKRWGLSSNGGTDLAGNIISTPNGLTVFDDELIEFSNERIYSYAQDVNKLIDKGPLPTATVKTSQVLSNNYQQTAPDCNTLMGVTVYAWEDSKGGCYCSVIDEASGSSIQNQVQLSASAIQPKVIACGLSLYIYFIDGIKLKCARISTSNPSATIVPVSVATDVNGAIKIYDVASDGSNMLLTYCKSGGYLFLTYVNQNCIVGSSTVNLPLGVTTSVAPNYCAAVLFGNTGTIFVLGADSTNGLRVQTFNLDLTTLIAVAVIDATVASIDYKSVTAVDASVFTAGHPDYLMLNVFYSILPTTALTDTYYIKSRIYAGAGAGGVSAAVLKRSVCLASKAWSYGGFIYFGACHVGPTNSLLTTYFVIRSDGVIVTKMLGGIAGAPTKPALSEVQAVSPGVYLMPLLKKGVLNSEGGILYTRTGLSRAVITMTGNRPIGTQLGENLHITGGFVRDYDGVSAFEHGYHVFPEGIICTASGSGGAILAGQYEYIVVFEWIDAKGQMHRSTPSIPASSANTTNTVVLSGSTSSVVLTIPTLRLTDKYNTRTDIVIAVYRTVANGTIFYKISSTSSPLFNDVTANTVTFTDTQVDSAIITNELLYTTGNVLGNDSPTAAASVSVYNNRLWIVTDQINQLAYSKTYGLGEGVGFSDYLTKQIESRGGRLLATAVLDDKLILFKDRALFFIVGNGPTNTGDGDDLTTPELIPSDVGLSDINSIALTPDGLLFNSAKGIHQIDHSLNVTYIGAEVEGILNGESIVATVAVDSAKEIRYVTATKTLVYNYFFKQWSTFTNGYGGVGAVNWLGKFCLCKADGTIGIETVGSYRDYGATYSQKIVTSWFKLPTLQGFGRLWKIFILGNFKSQHLLRVRVSYNYASTYTDTFIIDMSKIFGGYWGSGTRWGKAGTLSGTNWGDENDVYQFRVDPTVQLCESFQVTIEDLNGEESYTLEALSFEVGILDGGFRMSKIKTIARS